MRLLLLALLFTQVFSQVQMSDIKDLTNNQLDILKKEIQNNAATSTGNQNKNNAESTSPQKVQLKVQNDNKEDFYFGYEFLESSINFFDNIPTPKNYILGPGDEVVLFLWGQNNSKESFIINKDGMIFYENVGFINLSNKTIEQAEELLRKELSKVYSTINDTIDPTDLKLELGSLKSINIYLTGNVKDPGIKLIHPFSNIYTALVQAGGIKKSGSLRSIELIREKKIIATVDFYDFFINGKNNFEDIKIIDGDIINVPVVGKRATINGAIVNNGIFELKNNENLNDLIFYSSGFTSLASEVIIIDRVIPIELRKNNDLSREVITINRKDIERDNMLSDGDKITIESIPSFDRAVSIFGRVKNPGQYLISKETRLSDLLSRAGGFEDEIYKKSILTDNIVIIRKNPNEQYDIEFNVKYEDSKNFIVQSDDNIFVYANSDYLNRYFIEISGEIKNPGTYQHYPEMTVSSLINDAGGFLSSANQNIFLASINQNINTDNDVQLENSITLLSNLQFDDFVPLDSKITVLKDLGVVTVNGNVYSPGSLYLGEKNLTVSKAIKLAGGIKTNTKKNKIFVKKADGSSYKTSGALKRSISRLESGDIVIVPEKENDFDLTSFLTDISSTLANILTILLVVENIEDAS